jgi:hypothetical protein
MSTRLRWSVLFGFLFLSACGSSNPGGSLGDRCVASYACAVPLVCAQDGTCQSIGYPGTGNRDEECDSTLNCRLDFVCSAGGFCADPGDGNLGAFCQGTEDCFRGLLCSAAGICANPGDAGTAGHGDLCTEASDCEFGLFCSEEDATCHRLGGAGNACEGHDQCRETYFCDDAGICEERLGSGTPCVEAAQCGISLTCWGEVCSPIPLYNGVACQDPANETGPFRVYFELPPEDSTGEMEFYRLPFPNDIRLRDGRVDLSGHPDPGDLVPGEVITKYLAAIEAESEGFGLSTTSYFRFSGAVDYASMALSGDAANVLYLNIDPSSAGYGNRHSGLGFSASTAPGRYICHNWLAVHPLAGYPLRHSTTYAVILTDSITGDASEVAVPDDDFVAMVADIAPADAGRQAAWLAYAPLREFLADDTLPSESQVDLSRVIAASVFTTLDPDRRPPLFRQVIRNDPAVPTPDVTDVTLCEGVAVSPCDDGLDGAEHQRGCMGEDPAVHEIHGRFTTPIFQRGTPPYEDSGGDIAYTADSTPLVEGEQDVCFGLSVPRSGAMPVDGWPVVIYLHGTGGSFRSHFNNGVAVNLADVDLGGGVSTQMAVIGIDQVVHGDRREGNTTHPNYLFFNFTNPQAAKNNTLQGAADLFQLVRVVENFARQVNNLGEVRLDPNRIYFFGHSQGAISGPVAIPFEPSIRGVVYSGGGALLLESLLHKTSPVDIAGAVQFVLGDGDVGFTHPMLNLLQLYFEPVDAINYMSQLFLDPVDGAELRHALFSYGLGDTYSPNPTGRAMIRAAGANLIRPVLDPIAYVGELDAPVTGNRWGGTVTEGAVQLDTDTTYDGHFVLTRNPDGVTIYTTFLGTLDTDPQSIPTIPAW